ncbi:MAG TPA: hypothetical protein VHB70_15160 [Parafilimonas sp.]|nr:hypothetical protein [Parafilimonas sp.]
MKLLLQYKKLTAVVLLLLQVFISTPVQFYHHHNYSTQNIGSNNAKNYLPLHLSSKFKNNSASQTIVTEICPICNHQYTAYYNDYFFADVLFFNQPITAHYVNYIDQYTSTFAENPSNKSPPLFI